ncbi:hypothetical protein [Variovorax sp. EL159]|uniref:nSTAND3 domain-containing NTPase n=1 Tax=Variovorax sp. EL159 TaxID=1566270 RepID=UPI00089012CD|nr:hypothetical protein [Variovorax sp. EL159]SCX44434.1 hypothetical protein SAMN03159363_0757 [Variovorax sp. EL159]
MSIATVGQAKYEYQDLVCLEFILRFLSTGVICFIEPTGGEDATFQITFEGIRFNIELQVKGARSKAAAVDLPILAEYLAHFPAHRSSEFLLERLSADAHRVVVLVCAQRAKDDCADFTMLKDWNGEFHKPNSISSETTTKLLEAISVAKCDGVKGSRQRVLREKAVREFASSASTTSVRRSLERLILLDQWAEREVRSSLEHLIRAQGGIAGDMVGDVLSRLLRCLVSRKALDVDVVPEIRRILSDAKSPSIAPRDYVHRGQEQVWRDTLAEERVLLLSGPPRCGKSEAACWTAAQLENLGFSSKRTSSIEHAERILLDEGSGAAVIVLDDPLGAMHKDDVTVLRTLRHLEELVRNVPANRRLVVAQSQEPLLAATRMQRLTDVKIAGHTCRDLGIFKIEFLLDVWKSCAAMYRVSAKLATLVSDGLRAGKFTFAPGVLSHIAANCDELEDPASAADIERLAQQSAVQFGVTLAANQASEGLIAALAIGTSEIDAISERELAYILGEGGKLRKPDKLMSFVGYGGETEKPVLPDYESCPSLPSGAKGELVKLDRHRVISRSGDRGVLFSHPFYRAAARSVVERSTASQREELLNAVRRGLFSLSAPASAAVARNLPWLYRELGSAIDIREDLVQEAKDGLDSYFLTTRDLCYRFLVHLAHEFPKMYGEQLPSWVESARYIDIVGLAWQGKFAFVPVGMMLSGLELFLEGHRVPLEKDVAQTVSSMEVGDELPDMRSATELLRFYRGHPERLNSKILSRLLSYDAGVVRAEAADLWLRLDRAHDEVLLGRLARDAHPLVAARACRSSLEAWHRYSDERKAQVLGLLNGYVLQPETAAVVLDEALRFFNDDEQAKPKPWHAYQELVPSALRAFPVGFRLSAERLYSSARQALKRMPCEQAQSLAGAWVEWLERQLNSGELPDDYALGVWDGVAAAANFAAEKRLELLDRILSFPATGYALVFMADVVDEWPSLSFEERRSVLAVLSSDRADVAWLRAAAVTRREVPAEVQQVVLGAEDALSWAPDRLIKHIPDRLLVACTFLHCGSPQPLWYLGKHHRSEVWAEVVSHIARRPDHALFEACFVEVVHGSEEVRLNAVAAELATSYALNAFKIMVDRKVGVTGEWHRQAIDTFLQAADPTTLADMQAHMVAKAPVVLDHLSDIADWTSHRPTQQVLLSAFPDDMSLLTGLRRLGDDHGGELGPDEVPTVLELLRDKSPKLHQTYGRVQDVLKSAGARKSVVDEVDAKRRAAVRAKYAAIKSMRLVDTRGLMGWVGPGSR